MIITEIAITVGLAICKDFTKSIGKREIMLINISMDIPLPIPCWVINSPSHMIRTVPVVREMIIRKRVCKLKSGITPCPRKK